VLLFSFLFFQLSTRFFAGFVCKQAILSVNIVQGALLTQGLGREINCVQESGRDLSNKNASFCPLDLGLSAIKVKKSAIKVAQLIQAPERIQKLVINYTHTPSLK
jgi:hypothetical protein